MRILIVHNRYMNNGGEDKVVVNEVNWLRKKGHDVSIYFADNNILLKATFWKKLSLLFKSNWNKNFALKILSEAKKINAEIIHIHNFWLLISPATHYYLYKSGYPIVQTLHNYRLTCLNAMLLKNNMPCELCVGNSMLAGVLNKCYKKSIFHSYIIRRMVLSGRKKNIWNNSVTSYITFTNFSRNLFIKAGIPGNKLVVKPNSIDVTRKLSTRNKESIILFVGRLSKQKGMDTIIEVAKKIECKIVICGDGPYKEKLDNLNLKNIELVGFIPESKVKEYMKNASILFFPSISYEGMPITILEAMSTGLPCVASRIGGIPEIIDDGETGLLFDPNDIKECIKNINLLTSDNNLNHKMSQNALEKFNKNYSNEVVGKKLLSIYNDVLMKNKLIKHNN